MGYKKKLSKRSNAMIPTEIIDIEKDVCFVVRTSIGVNGEFLYYIDNFGKRVGE